MKILDFSNKKQKAVAITLSACLACGTVGGVAYSANKPDNTSLLNTSDTTAAGDKAEKDETVYVMYKNINKAVVFGAGTMGASIAALLASVGVETVMLDIVPPKGLNDDEIAKGYTTDTYEYRNRFTLAGIDRIKKPKNMLLYSKGAIKNIRIGNTTDNMDEVSTADWIIEAVSERIDIKQSVLSNIAKYRKGDAIVSSNTSGVSVTKIVDGLDPELQKYFMKESLKKKSSSKKQSAQPAQEPTTLF